MARVFGLQSTATNPILRNFPSADRPAKVASVLREEGAGFAGATNKAAVLILLCAAVAIQVWQRAGSLIGQKHEVAFYFVAFLALSGVAAALVWLTVRQKQWAPWSAPLYALVQGFLLGVIAAGTQIRYADVGILAVLELSAMPLGLLIAYRSGLVRVADGFHKKTTMAMGGAVLFFAANFVLGRMGKPAFSLRAAGVPGAFVLVVLAYLAAICMTADFDSAAEHADAHPGATMEWYIASGLVLSMMWFLLDAIDVYSFWEAAPQGPPGGDPPGSPI